MNRRNVLTKAILLDLERQLSVKVENTHLYPCLVYDFLFAHFVIGPFFVTTWRGTWENLDFVFDVFLCGGDLKKSTWTTLALGSFVSFALIFFQHEIRAYAHSKHKVIFMLISRAFTVLRFHFDIVMWKGVWGLFHDVIGNSWLTSFCAFVGPSIVLLVTRCYKSSIACPMGMGIDRPETYISVPTILRSKVSDSLEWRLLDVSLTVPMSCIAVAAFYGVWTGLDWMFASTDDDFPTGLARNGGYCILIGLCIDSLAFIVQFLFVWLHYKNKVVDNLAKTRKITKIVRLIGYDVMLILVLIGNVATFRGIWNVLDALFLPDRHFLSTTICHVIGLVYLILLYSGSSVHAGAFRDDNETLFPNFFFTYLLSQKPE